MIYSLNGLANLLIESWLFIFKTTTYGLKDFDFEKIWERQDNIDSY